MASSKRLFAGRLFSGRLFAPALWRGLGEAAVEVGAPLGGIARTFSRIGGIAYTRPIIRSNDRTESTIGGTASTR